MCQRTQLALCLPLRIVIAQEVEHSLQNLLVNHVHADPFSHA